MNRLETFNFAVGVTTMTLIVQQLFDQTWSLRTWVSMLAFAIALALPSGVAYVRQRTARSEDRTKAEAMDYVDTYQRESMYTPQQAIAAALRSGFAAGYASAGIFIFVYVVGPVAGPWVLVAEVKLILWILVMTIAVLCLRAGTVLRFVGTPEVAQRARDVARRTVRRFLVKLRVPEVARHAGELTIDDRLALMDTGDPLERLRLPTGHPRLKPCLLKRWLK